MSIESCLFHCTPNLRALRISTHDRRPIEKGEMPMLREGKAMVVPAGALIMAVTAALLPSSVLGEGGARRDAVRQAAESTGAERAAPTSLSKHATIMSREGQVVRKGSNGWTCMPDNPGTTGTDSICMNEPWLTFMDAMKQKK